MLKKSLKLIAFPVHALLWFVEYLAALPLSDIVNSQRTEFSKVSKKKRPF